MDFRARHPQPFTLETAIHLDVPTIATEISRLQLSLQHLQSSQSFLLEHLSGPEPHDKDTIDAINENKETIASQEERIQMLRFALERKGISTTAANSHYDIPVHNSNGHTQDNDDDGQGVYL